MSMLRSAIEEHGSVALDDLTDIEIEEDVVELSWAIDRLSTLLAERVDRAARRQIHLSHGFASVTAWLASIADMESSTARHTVAMGTFVTSTRAGRLARSGDLSAARARRLARLHRHHPDAYQRDESLLLDHADDFSLPDFTRIVRHWANCADATAAEASAAAEQHERAYLHASPTFGGMVRLEGLIDQGTGEVILGALDTAMTDGARDGEDQRPTSNRRAEALGEICRQWLDRGAKTVGHRRPHVAVVLDLDALETRAGRRCEADHTGTITPESARRLACDAAVTRVITRGTSEILDVGRSTRTVPIATRKALEVRDRHCRMNGCTRPVTWCDAHHLVHWADGGLTDLVNLILLCRRHHTTIHSRPTRIVDGTVMLM